MNLFKLSQLFGILAAFSMFASSWQKTRNKILFYLIFDNIFYFLQYLLLGAYSGAMSNIVGLLRTISFSKKGKNRFYKTNIMLYIIVILHVFVGLVTYDGILSLFPIFASILYAIVLWQDNTTRIRIGTSIVLFMWIIYNFNIQAYISFLAYIVLFLSYLLSIIRIDIYSNEKLKNKKINLQLMEKKI